MPKQIVIVAVLDTKAEEARLIRDRVAARGHSPAVADVGTRGEPETLFGMLRR
jgi:uncharacterized protein (UPF0261 family)